MTRRSLLAAVSLATVAALAGCNNLSTLNRLNALTPGDGSVVKRVDSAAYGPDPRQRLDVYAPEEAARYATADAKSSISRRATPLRSGVSSRSDPPSQPAAGSRQGAPSHPVLVFFYGGGWNSGYRAGYAFVAKAFAARGFVVVVPDYRLVPAVRFPVFVDDGAAAIRWTIDHIAASGGDPKRIAVAGHSAGAHIAMLLALDPHYLAAAGVPGSIKAVAGLAGPYDFLPFDQPSAVAAFSEARDPKATQPISFVRADAPPVLLLTGDADDVVRPRNTIALAAALRAKGASVETRSYPGVGHIGILLSLSKPFRGKADALATMTEFFGRTLN